MKKVSYFLSALVIAATISHCTNPADRSVSGIYVSRQNGTYSVVWDTLVVTAINLTAHTYEIQRHSGYQRIKDGKRSTKAFKTEKWLAVYDVKNDRLLEDGSELGRQLWLDERHRCLRQGTDQYRRE